MSNYYWSDILSCIGPSKAQIIQDMKYFSSTCVKSVSCICNSCEEAISFAVHAISAKSFGNISASGISPAIYDISFSAMYMPSHWDDVDAI